LHVSLGTTVIDSLAQQNVTVNDFAINLSEVSNEHQAALDVQIAIKAYCRVVEKRVVDQAAQLCYFWFIDQCALQIDSKLSSIFTSAVLFEWMREPFEQQRKRENLKKSIQSMERALSTGQNA
jgi:pyruvate-formate lyase